MVRWLLPARLRPARVVIPVVRLSGVIAAESASPISRNNLSISAIAEALEKAFANKKAPAVALIINSPGGSPVQSHMIHKRIRALAAEHGKPVIGFVEDAAASGGYMIACAADDIYADPSSVVGSIGVISAGFGFSEAISRLGIERRVVTAGSRKGMLDPFSAVNPDDVERLKRLQARVHELFVSLVRARRGAKLAEGEAELFSGEFWSGAQALELGLIDGLGDIRAVLRERFGDKVKIELISSERGFFSRRSPAITTTIGARLAETMLDRVITRLDERSLWGRIGL